MSEKVEGQKIDELREIYAQMDENGREKMVFVIEGYLEKQNDGKPVIQVQTGEKRSFL